MPITLRFPGATDKTKLAMNSGRDTVMIEMALPIEYMHSPKKYAVYVKAREFLANKIRVQFEGRPHWQKEFLASPQSQYPAEAWDGFGRLSIALGQGNFTNEWNEKFTPARD